MQTALSTNSISMASFQGYEISPMRMSAEHSGACEVCRTPEAEFWMLSGVVFEGAIEPLAQKLTRQECETQLYRLTGSKRYSLVEE